MEITIEDLTKLKQSPTIIFFLKTIIAKDNKVLGALNLCIDIWALAKHLEKDMIIKIVGDELSVDSFWIRDNKILGYLSSQSSTIENDVDEVIEYFKKITGKTRVSNKSNSNRKFIKARLQEYTVKDLKDVINLKYNQWKDDYKMRDYIRIETLMNETKFQGYIAQLETIELNDFKDDI